MVEDVVKELGVVEEEEHLVLAHLIVWMMMMMALTTTTTNKQQQNNNKQAQQDIEIVVNQVTLIELAGVNLSQARLLEEGDGNLTTIIMMRIIVIRIIMMRIVSTRMTNEVTLLTWR